MKTSEKSGERRVRGSALKWIAAGAIVAVLAVVVAMEMYFDGSPGRSSSSELSEPVAIKQDPALATPDSAQQRPKMFIVTPSGSLINATPDADMAMTIGNIGEKFHVDAKGRLVQNEKTRLHIEALVALTDADKLYDAVEDELRDLPADAAARARELIERYKLYIADQQKLVPPGVAPVNEDEALAQINAQHDLRVAHFGAKTAEAFYGEEEKTNRQLVELMRIEKDPTLNMEQKAERAQVMYDKMQRLTTNRKTTSSE